MSGGRSRVLAIAALLLAGLALAACGDRAPTDEQRATAVLDDLWSDLAAGRIGAACAALAERPRREIGSVGHGRKPTTCRRDLRDLVLTTQEAAAAGNGSALGRGPRPRVVEVRITGDGRSADAILALNGGRFRAPLVKHGDEWLLADFFGSIAPAPRDLR